MVDILKALKNIKRLAPEELTADTRPLVWTCPSCKQSIYPLVIDGKAIVGSYCSRCSSPGDKHAREAIAEFWKADAERRLIAEMTPSEDVAYRAVQSGRPARPIKTLANWDPNRKLIVSRQLYADTAKPIHPAILPRELAVHAELLPNTDLNCIYLCGPSDVGKTHLAQGYMTKVRELHKNRPGTMRFVSWLESMSQIKAAFDTPEVSGDKIIQDMMTPWLLVIDDFDKSDTNSITAWQASCLLRVLEYRIRREGLPTVFTANTAPEEMLNRIGSSTNSASEETVRAIIARIKENLWFTVRITQAGRAEDTSGRAVPITDFSLSRSFAGGKR
jgi:hypothetical protein